MSAPEEIKPQTEMVELQQIDTNKPGVEGATEPEPERTKLQTLKVYRKVRLRRYGGFFREDETS